ncbi:MAG: hypothetical protein IJX63_08930 [Lachnospiraceae bacterium]|nr:hypothetical protein [Lachnospiraceae bacterium]
MEDKAMQGVEAEGFLFLNGEDAALADKERKQVEYLEKHLDYKNAEQVLSVYQKLIEERTFKTPVGTIYLKHLQNYLLNKAYIAKERVTAIPVDEPCDRAGRAPREKLQSVRVAAKRRQEQQATNHKISVILNFVLIAVILVMFWMTMQSETPNMVNYRVALENKYATWEQELTEREQEVRAKELELKISQE